MMPLNIGKHGPSSREELVEYLPWMPRPAWCLGSLGLCNGSRETVEHPLEELDSPHPGPSQPVEGELTIPDEELDRQRSCSRKRESGEPGSDQDLRGEENDPYRNVGHCCESGLDIDHREETRRVCC